MNFNYQRINISLRRCVRQWRCNMFTTEIDLYYEDMELYYVVRGHEHACYVEEEEVVPFRA